MESANSQIRSEKKPQNKPYQNIDRSQVNKCTMCNYKSHVKSNFQRHLMKTHGVKLKGLEEGITGHYATLGRVVNDYGISQYYSKKAVSARTIFAFECKQCHKRFNTLPCLTFHKKICNNIFKALKNNQPMHTCEQCGTHFSKFKGLSKHRGICGRAKGIHCQLCPFKSATLSSMQRHFIDRHNLICKAVEEPDFDQALNKTPYTLERAVEFEHLPNIKELDSLPEKELLRPIDQQTVIPVSKQRNNRRRRHNRMFPCAICGQEFLKEKHLNQHRKYDKCSTKLSKTGK